MCSDCRRAVNEAVMNNGRIDMTKLQLIARLGYNDYVKIEDNIFELIRPQVTKPD